MRRENLEQADHSEIGHDGSGHERTYAQCATNFRIDTQIVSRVLTRNEKVAANTFSRQPVFHVHRGSERWSWLTGARPADHLAIREKRQCRATGSRETQGAPGDELQNRIDVVTNLADLALNCFHPGGRSVSIEDGEDTAGLNGGHRLAR